MKSALLRSDALRLPFPDQSVDLVVGSPPYCDARTYGIGAQRNAHDWVEWMLRVTTEALRVSRGAVIWVAAGVTRERTYWPACEGLMWEWFKRGGSAYRPCYWHRVGIPGSGGDQWYRADVEYAMCFKRAGSLPFAEPTANGRKPKHGPGGPMSHRLADGSRVHSDWASRTRYRKADGTRDRPSRPCHERYAVEGMIANPGVLFSTGAAGGNNLGDHRAHENEAPYPVAVPAFFIRSHCPPGGLVLDPFSGSGTTGHAALQEGRRYVGCDIRQSQCELGRRRLSEVTPSLFGGVA
jgi:hypothetical protein